MESEVAQSCPILCDPMDCGPPGSSIHGISQARIREWVAISFSRRSSRPRDRTQVSHIVGRQLYHLSHQGSSLISRVNINSSSIVITQYSFIINSSSLSGISNNLITILAVFSFVKEFSIRGLSLSCLISMLCMSHFGF